VLTLIHAMVSLLVLLRASLSEGRTIPVRAASGQRIGVRHMDVSHCPGQVGAALGASDKYPSLH